MKGAFPQCISPNFRHLRWQQVKDKEEGGAHEEEEDEEDGEEGERRGSPPAGHVGLCDHKTSKEVEDRDHVGGAHCRNLQIGSQSNSYHPCNTHVLI